MTSARESALHANEGAPNKVNYKPSGRDPLEAIVGATPAGRLRWELIEQGHDPALFDVADDPTRPGTVVVRTPLRTAVRGLIAVWWDASADRAVGLCAGSDDDMQAAAAVLEALTAAGPGDLANAPPDDSFDPLVAIVAAAHRLGIVVRFRSQMMARKNNLSVIFATRDWLASDGAPQFRATDRAVLLALVVHMKQNGTEGRPRVDRLAQIVGRKPGTVRKALYRLRDAGVIEATVKHPHEGTAQVWKLSSAFLAVLKVDSERRDVEDTSGAERSYESGPEVLRGGSRGVTPVAPKAAESIESSSMDESDEYVGELVDAVLDRREAAGETFRNRPALKRKMIREDRDRLLAEDAELRALVASTAALDKCSHCDHAGLRWSLPDGTPATRSTLDARGDRCDHADAGDVVVPIKAAAR